MGMCQDEPLFLAMNRGWVVYLLTSNTNPAFVSTLNELPLVVTPNAASASLANNSPARLADKVGNFIAEWWDVCPSSM